MTKEDSTKAALSTALFVSIAANFFLLFKWQESKAYNATLSHPLEQVAKDLTKEKTGVEATLAECNAALATIQSKPKSAPVVCLTPPPALICPPSPTCPAIPEPTACICAPVFPCGEPVKIATPVPAATKMHKHTYSHRRHVVHAIAPPECLRDTGREQQFLWQ
jgi:hypothetical protein